MISNGQKGQRGVKTTGVSTPERLAPRAYSAPKLVQWGKLAEITQGPAGALTDAPFAGSRNGE